MLKEKIQKKIESQFEAIEESSKYILEAQCEMLSSIDSIRYMLYLHDIEDQTNIN